MRQVSLYYSLCALFVKKHLFVKLVGFLNNNNNNNNNNDDDDDDKKIHVTEVSEAFSYTDTS